jgi:hypothetical protein
MMEAAITSEMLVNFNQNSQHNNPADNNLDNILAYSLLNIFFEAVCAPATSC